jgi:hypothetical protein
MLFKRGATLSAAEGGCKCDSLHKESNADAISSLGMAEVGVASAMAAAAFAACMGATPHIVTVAAEIGIEHNLGLTVSGVMPVAVSGLLTFSLNT